MWNIWVKHKSRTTTMNWSQFPEESHKEIKQSPEFIDSRVITYESVSWRTRILASRQAEPIGYGSTWANRVHQGYNRSSKEIKSKTRSWLSPACTTIIYKIHRILPGLPIQNTPWTRVHQQLHRTPGAVAAFTSVAADLLSWKAAGCSSLVDIPSCRRRLHVCSYRLAIVGTCSSLLDTSEDWLIQVYNNLLLWFIKDWYVLHVYFQLNDSKANNLLFSELQVANNLNFLIKFLNYLSLCC